MYLLCLQFTVGPTLDTMKLHEGSLTALLVMLTLTLRTEHCTQMGDVTSQLTPLSDPQLKLLY